MKRINRILLTLLCIALLVSAMVLAVSASDTEGETAEAPKYAILLIGQSNGSGRGFEDTGYSISDSNILMWDWSGVSGEANRWVSVLEPQSTNGGGGVPQHASLGTSFAEAFEREFGESVGIINAAIGGVAIQTFEPGATNYINAVNAAKGAVATGTQIVGVLWHQGESNQAYGTDAHLYDGVYPDYEDVLENLINSMLKEIGCSNDLPIVAGELPHFPKGSYYIALADQLEAKAKSTPNWGFARLDKLTHIGDNIHIDTLSLRILGLRYFKEFYRIYTGEELTKYDSAIADMENTLEPITKSGKMLNSSGDEGNSTWELDLKTGTLTINCVGGETLPNITISKDHMKGDFGFYDYRRSITRLVINGYTTLTEGIFQDLKYLEEIVIGDSITSVHKDTFKNCPSINKITIGTGWASKYTLIPFRCSEQIADMKIIIGDTIHEPVVDKPFVLSEDRKTLITVIEERTSYEIPEGVETILDGAFEGMSKITSVSIPASVKTIGANAFNECTSLKTVTFASGSQLTTINANAFQNCDAIEELVLPEGLTTIGASAFAYSDKLKVLDMPKTVTALGKNMLAGCNSIEVIKTPTLHMSDPTSNTNRTDAMFMNIFGTSEFIGSVAVTQYAFSNPITFYVPESLRVVIIDGANAYIGTGSLSNLTMLEAIVLADASFIRTNTNGETPCMTGSVNATVYTTADFDLSVGATVHGLNVYPADVSCDAFLGNTVYTGTSFELGDGTWSGEEITAGDVAGRIILPAEDKIAAVGYNTLVGWNNGTMVFAPGAAAYVFENNTTFTAVYARNYQVTFTSTLEGTTLPEIKFTTDEIILPASPESPDADYGFAGWMVEGTLYQPGDVIDVKALDKDITVEAYIIKKFVVSFTGEGTMPEAIKTLGEFTFPAEPTNGPAGKTFSGWSSDEGVTLYQPGDVFTVEADTTYTAIWSTPVTITITGEGMPEDIVITDHPQGAPYVLPKLPTTAVVAGKAFIGWDDGTTVYAGGAEVDIDGTVTFTAVWRSGATQINVGDYTVDDYITFKEDAYQTLADAGLYDLENNKFLGHNNKGVLLPNETIQIPLGVYNQASYDYPTTESLFFRVYDDYAGHKLEPANAGYRIDLVTNVITTEARFKYQGQSVEVLGQKAFEVKVTGVYADKKTQVKLDIPVDNVTVANAQLINFNYLYTGSYTGSLELTVTFTDDTTVVKTSIDAIAQAADAWDVMTFSLAGVDETKVIKKITLKLIDNQSAAYGKAYPVSGDTFTIGTATFVPAAMSNIDFYSNDVKLPELTITTKEPFEVPAAPATVPEGYYFGGWSADLDGDGEPETYQTGETVTVMADTRFDAKWIKIPIATFVDGETEAAVSITNKDAFGLPDCNLTAPEFYYFAGWQAEGTNVVLDAGASVTLAGDTVYHAVWKLIPVATFVYNGDTLYTYRDLEYTVIPEWPENITPPANQVFACWLADLDGDGEPEQHYAGDTVTITKDTEFTPEFAPLVEITINDNQNNDNGTTGTTRSDWAPEGTEYTLPLMPENVLAGAQFLGWSDGTTTFDPGATITVPATATTYKAVWFVGYKINIADRPFMLDGNGDEITSYNPDKTTGADILAGYASKTDISYQLFSITDIRNWSGGTVWLIDGLFNYNTYHHFTAQFVDTDSDSSGDAVKVEIKDVSDKSYSGLATNLNLKVGEDAGEAVVPYKNAQLVTIKYKYTKVGTFEDKMQLSVTIGGKAYTVMSEENMTATNGEWGTLTFNLAGLSTAEAPIDENASVTHLALRVINEPRDGDRKLKKGDIFYYGEVVLEALPEATVNVYNGETSVASETVKGSYTLPAAPEAADETVYFGGWSDGTTTYKAGANVTLTKNTTFNAVWLNNFKVTFTSGESSMDTYTHETFTLPTEAELEALGITGPEGTEFTGWVSSADGVKYDAGTSVTPTADVTYTAEWLIPYKATFMSNGSEVGSESTFDPITIPAAPENADASKTFAYWSADVDGDGTPEEYHPNDTVTITADTIFTAVYGDKISITVNYNDGVTANGSFYIAEGEDFELSQLMIERDGFTLIGWDDGNTTLAVDAVISGITANVELTAVWEEKVLVGQDVNLLPAELEFNTGTSNGGKYSAASVFGATSGSQHTNGNLIRAYNSGGIEALSFEDRDSAKDLRIDWKGYALADASAPITISTKFLTNNGTGLSFTVNGKTAFATTGDFAVSIGGTPAGTLTSGVWYVATITIADPSNAAATATVSIAPADGGDAVATGSIEFGASVTQLDFVYLNAPKTGTRLKVYVDYIRATQYVYQ